MRAEPRNSEVPQMRSFQSRSPGMVWVSLLEIKADADHCLRRPSDTEGSRQPHLIENQDTPDWIAIINIELLRRPEQAFE